MSTRVVHIECFKTFFQGKRVRFAERISILKFNEKGILEMAFLRIFLHFDELRSRLYLRLDWQEYSVLEWIK